MQGFVAHWQLQLPRLILALLTYLLLARLVPEVSFGVRSTRRAVRFCRRLTNPVVCAVATITPRVVPDALLTGCAIVWVLAVRVALAQLVAALAMRRMLG